ncbi:hypothetical protein [Kitasatospora kifunensis]|uniref:Guanylate cyclase domain-containing protein n=1 Tax=Kitasatospora kifunensis TaxID=58351 RepID=A0A7W7QYI9_KITKI|nr:hypothetical protein [Kitasatospora kifunensis]MBB4921889.1 hypothetical protein [Kitasatospora kifunensis]
MERAGIEDPRDIPEYQALLVVDMKGYSRAPSHLMGAMRGDLDSMLATAMAESGLGGEWHQHGYWSDRGDGFLVAMPVSRLWRLVDPLPENLENILARHDRERFASTPEIRVRMSVHVGPLPESYRGHPINDVCRLVDSDAAKSAVSRAQELGSFVAVVISDAVFQTVVRARRTIRLRERDFLGVQAEVAEKFSERAWVHVPRRTPSELGEGAERLPEDVAQGSPVSGAGSAVPTPIRIDTESVGNFIASPTGPLTFTQDFRRSGI